VLAMNTGATAPEWSTAGAGDVTKVGTPANNQVGVWTGDGTIEGDADFVFDGTNVGIGIQTPPNVLSVSPVQYSTGTASQSTTAVTGAGGATFTAAMVGSEFVYADGTSSGAITAFIDGTHVTVTTSQTVSSQAYKIHYQGLQVTSTGDLTVDTDTLYVDSADSRVGMGTDDPESLLHLHGDGNPVLTISSPDAQERSIQFNDAGAMGAKINCDASENLEFKTGGSATNKLIIMGGGNVGIGEDTPESELHVSGTVRVDNGEDGGNSFYAYSTITYDHLFFVQQDSTGNASLALYEEGGGQGVKLDAAGDSFFKGGNVGVGTAVPGSALWTGTKNITIEDTAVGYFLKNSTSGLELNIASDSSGTVYFDVHGSTDAADNAFVFRTENSDSQSTPTERMRITSGGRVTVKKASNSEVEPLTDVADTETITVDFDLASNFSLTIDGAEATRELGNPSSENTLVPGQSGCIVITQDSTGGGLLTYGSNWNFEEGDEPVLSTGALAVDTLAYYVADASNIHAVLLKDMSN